MAESTSTLQAKLKALTHGKVDIMADADTFKNTTQILREMAAAWEDMTDIERAAALELMGGKRQANILASVITNFETVEDVIETSMNSSGSAMAENAKWLDSIEGKTYQFTNALEAMWNNMLDSNVIKGFLDFGTKAIQFLDTVPGTITAIVAAVAGFAKVKGINLVKLLPDTFKHLNQYSQRMTQLSALGDKKLGLKLGSAKDGWNIAGLNAYANAVKGLSANEQAELLIKQNLNREQITEIMRRSGVSDKVIQETLSKKNLLNTNRSLQKVTVQDVLTTDQATDAAHRNAIATYLAANGHKTLTKALLDEMRIQGLITNEQYLQYLGSVQGSLKGVLTQLAKSPGIILMIATALTGLIGQIKTTQEKTEELVEEFNKLQTSMSEIEGEIGSIDSELETIQDRIDELNSKDKLSIADAEELKLLQQQSEELQRQKKTQEQLLAARESQEDAKSIKMINNLLKTTAAGQQKAAEDTATAWKYALGALVAVGLGAAGFFTGGGTWAAVPTALAWAVGGAMLGGEIGNHAGHYIGMNDKEAGDSLIEWYESYEDAIETAEKEASEAETKYLNDMTEKNREKWQKKLEYVNTLQTEMYDGLTEMQGYISNLEYNDSTSGIIDGYNDLMTHLSVKSNDGSIDGQISAIKSLQDEFYELSRGVDANGKNVALTAEEYARYCDIVDQILSYTPSLIQGYDAEGNAILGTADAQLTYNQLIAESIELLKEQRREAAIQGVTDQALSDIVNSANNTYQSTIKEAANYDDLIYGKDNYNLTRTIEIIEQIVGVEQNGWDKFWGINEAEYVLANAEQIAAHKEEILQAMQDTGYYGGSGLSDYDKWLSGLIQSARSASEQANNYIKSSLYMAPMSSESYDNLSGSQISFINSYIASLDGLKDKSEKEVKAIRGYILEMTEKIASNDSIQKAIEDFYKLDPAKVPVKTYTEELNKLTQQMLDEDIIDVKDVNDNGIANMLVDMFIGDVPIDEMQNAIKEKLNKSSRGLVEHLSIDELRVAFKIIPDLDGDISFEELRQEIQKRLPKATGPVVQTYSTLNGQVEKFNDVVSQTSEIVLDNTKVTQEYKDSLIELGISEEELAECFDATNGLVVANAEKLNELVKNAKDNTAQNAKLAKSQARLQYYELYKEMQDCFDASGNLIDGKKDEIATLYDEMNALEKVIAKYSRLETSLLGATNAYDKLADAQATDEAFDYGSKAEEMVKVLGDAITSKQLGTEAAQVAMAGLIPDWVMNEAKTPDEKIQAMYKYFTTGPLSKLFTIGFNDDGEIESVEMTLDNLKKVVNELGADGEVLSGSWDGFTLNSEIQSIDDFAEKVGWSKEVTFAFLTELEKYDISWLNGDYSTFLDQFLASTTESKMQLAIQNIADLNAKFADGSIEADKYAEKLAEYEAQLNAIKTESNKNLFGEDGADGSAGKLNTVYAVDENTNLESAAFESYISGIDGYLDAAAVESDILELLKTKTNEYYQELEKLGELKNANASTEDIDAQQQKVDKLQTKVDNLSSALVVATDKKNEFTEPGVLEIETSLDDINTQIKEAGDKFDEALGEYFVQENGYWVLDTNVTSNISDVENKMHGIAQYVNLLNSKTRLVSTADTEETQSELDKLNDTLTNIRKILETKFKLELDATGAYQTTSDFKKMWDSITSKTVELWTKFINPGHVTDVNTSASVNGTAHASGTAYKSGSWGADKTETALTGELGPEMIVRGNQWHLVGENGAEFTQVKKGDIIFNHRQTEELLRNGHIAGRGKAYANGTHGAAYAHVMGTTLSEGGQLQKEVKALDKLVAAVNDTVASVAQITQATVDTWGSDAKLSEDYNNGKTDSGSGSGSDSDSDEIMDWIEVRMEEIEESLGKLSAELENAVGYAAKNNKIEAIIAKNREKLADSYAGADYYENYAQQYYDKIPSQYQEMAKNGEIAITDFAGKASDATLEAINKYREYIQKASDLRQQAEEVLTEIRDLAIQRIDNAYDDGSVRATVEDSQTGKLQNAVDYDEARGLITSDAYYTAMMENSNKKIEYLTASRDAMQKELDLAVQNGEIVKGSNEWYEQINKMYEVDAEIAEATIEIEEFQNAINDIYWDNFDQLISRIDYLKEETQNLIDLMDSEDMIVDPSKRMHDGGTVEYWTEEDVKWTKEGIASLGLYAQQMEMAEYQSKQYAKAIDDLTKDYENGLYSENEYYEKLNELKNAQYDSIEAYHDAERAIQDLNKTRIDSIKDGISKEIDAYEELINTKKKALDTEKD